jgi:glycerate kinase
MSDGGEGLLETLIAHGTMELHGLDVAGPLGDPVFASLGRRDGCWWIESAEAIGLQHTTRPRHPLVSTSAGLGTLIRTAFDRGCGPLIIGLGGSATVDGGLGMLQELGLTAIDDSGHALPLHGNGGDLCRVARLQGEPIVSNRLVRVLCDVRTTVSDSITTFGPQKGLAPDAIAPQSDAMEHWVTVLDQWRAEHNRPPLDHNVQGGGAAGGIAYALAAVLNGHLTDGARFVSRITGLEAAIADTQHVIIGEGQLDASSYRGKVAEVVTALARGQGAQITALVGQARDVPPAPLGPDNVIEINGENELAFNSALETLVRSLS